MLNLAVVAFSANSIWAEEVWVVGGGTAAGIQTPSEEDSIMGIRMSIGYAENKRMYGFDFGTIGNMTKDDFRGMAISGIFNITGGRADVILMQAAGGINWNIKRTQVFGTQFAIGVNVNQERADIYGLQMGLIGNFGNNNIYGFQMGMYNQANQVYGFQVGLVNRAVSLTGIQLGLLNFVEKGWLKFFPFLNVGF